MKQIVNISIGQAGIQLSESLIDLYRHEHHLNALGQRLESTQSSELAKENSEELHKNRKSQNLSAIFDEDSRSHLKARFILLDTQPDVINSLRHSQSYPVFNPSYFISAKQSANTYAHAYYPHHNTRIMQSFADTFRKATQSCDHLDSFVLNHAIQGGTGSGSTPLIAQIIAQTFPKILKTNFIISYEPANCNTPVAPYNTAFGLSKLTNDSDLCIMADNFSLNKLLQQNLDIHYPNYKNLNNLISQIHSSYTLSMRHKDCILPCDIKQIQTNLVCYPRIHWVVPSFIPLIAEKDENLPWTNNVNPKFMVERSFDRSCQLLNQQRTLCGNHFTAGKLISSVLLGRGEINEYEFLRVENQVKRKQSWMDFCPLGTKTGLSSHKATQIHINDPKKHLTRSLTSLTSTMQFNYYLSRINSFYDRIYSRRSFVHWYLGAGMEEMQMNEAREDMAALEKDYQEWNGVQYVEEDGEA